MCGIVGIYDLAGKTVPLLLSTLHRLEYRGYDSAGIAVVGESGEIICRKKEGKVEDLSNIVEFANADISLGIGHTRWATQGVVSDINSHPICGNNVAVAHNGFVENYDELFSELSDLGYRFRTDTDTEVIVWLIEYFLERGFSPLESVRLSLMKLKGSYAVSVLFAGKDNLIISGKRHVPLMVGRSASRIVVSSDVFALKGVVDEFLQLGDNELVVSSGCKLSLYDPSGDLLSRQYVEFPVSVCVGPVTKDGYKHFMLKEIYEQPAVMDGIYKAIFGKDHCFVGLPFDWLNVQKIHIVACGSSYFAGVMAKYWFESLAGIEVEVSVASEFCYSSPRLRDGGLVICISQSGETADTLSALRYAKKQNAYVVALVNVEVSTIAMEADFVINIMAGQEVGVASTKTMTSQMFFLLRLVIFVADCKDVLSEEEQSALLLEMGVLSESINKLFCTESQIVDIAHQIKDCTSILLVGRGVFYGVALEGALKLTEITYIHASAIAAGELKHGLIALLDKGFPVIVVNPFQGNALFKKTLLNIREMLVRGARVFVVTDSDGAKMMSHIPDVITLPSGGNLSSPFLSVVALQLLSYHVAVLRGNDIDQPRNLAKSVTVE